MNIAIIGSGGVGGYFGAKLAQAGNSVTFLARGAHLDAMRQKGLKVKSINGDFYLPSVTVVENILEIENPELILVGVKAWQIQEIRDELKKIVQPQTTIIPLQNGVMAYEELCECIGGNHVVGGLCRIISKIDKPGVINHFGVNPNIVLGEMDKTVSERVLQIETLLNNSGINTRATNKIEVELWKKFISICVSGFLAVTRSTYGQILEVPEPKNMMKAVMDEIFELSEVLNIGVESDYVEKTMNFFTTMPYNSTSSLARDIWDEKPSELEYQNGTVVKLAKKHGVLVPVNEFIYTSLLLMEKRVRGGK